MVLVRINFDCLEPLRVRQWVIEDIGIRDEPCVAVTEILFGFAGQTAIGCPTVAQLTLFPSGYSRQETSSWEQRKFSDLTDRVSIQSNDPNLPQVEYEDIISGEGALNKDLNDKEGGKTGIKFYVGDVLYGKLRPYLMNWLYPQFNGVAVGDFWVLRATECDSSFLYRLVQTDGFQRLANVSSGSKMPRADWNLISQSFFAVPANHAEQKAIAKSLAELDSLITLHQRECQYHSLCG